MPLLREVTYRAVHRILGISRLQSKVEAARTRLNDAIVDGIFDPNQQFAMVVNQTLEW